MILICFIFLLNYFWLDNDPVKSASWYCDQHCFKIGSEVIESIWDAVDAVSPSLFSRATDQGIPMTYRRHRHAKKGLWHPLSVWHCLCRANMYRGLVNAKAIFDEHTKRTGTVHKALTDYEFLIKNIRKINFNNSRWMDWYNTQNGTVNMKNSEERKAWCARHAIDENGVSLTDVNRNTCKMTTPPIMVFDECRVENNIIKSYKNYYHAKIFTIKNGMRYYYTPIPSWLKDKDKIKTRKK